jgi:hypothetical protein
MTKSKAAGFPVRMSLQGPGCVKTPEDLITRNNRIEAANSTTTPSHRRSSAAAEPACGARYRVLGLICPTPAGMRRREFGTIVYNMTIKSTLGSRSGARKGRVLSPAFLRRQWKPGQSGNPSGHAAEYGEVIKLARRFSVRAMERLGELMESDDERVAAVAAIASSTEPMASQKSDSPSRLTIWSQG